MKNNPSRIVFFDHTDMALRFLFLLQIKQSACFFFCPACASIIQLNADRTIFFHLFIILTSEKL